MHIFNAPKSVGEKKGRGDRPAVKSVKHYYVKSIHEGIIGQGGQMGTPCVFVEFADREDKCKILYVKELVKQITRHKLKRVQFIGHLPEEQVDLPLMQPLHQKGYVMFMHVTGTRIIDPIVLNGISWLSVCPVPGKMWLQKKGEELMIIWYPEMDMDEWKEGEFAVRYIQPARFLEWITDVVDLVCDPMYAAIWKVGLNLEEMMKEMT